MKDSFILYIENEEDIKDLTDEEAGQLLKAIYIYASTGEVVEMARVVKAVFNPIRRRIDRDAKKWEEICRKRAEAGSKGGKQTQANQANAKGGKQTQANQAELEPEPDPEPDNDYYNNNNDNAREDYDIPPQDPEVSRIIKLYAENNGEAYCTPEVGNDISYWCERAGPPLVAAAIKHCAKQGKKPWSYVEKPLMDWHEKGYKTMADVELHENKRGKANGQSRGINATERGSGKSKYNLPDFTKEPEYG